MQQDEINVDNAVAAVEAIKPSGPAQLISQPARSAFLLKTGEETIFSATVKVWRDEAVLPFKEAGARLFVLSRSDGWDAVRQSIRIAGIGLLPGDKLVLKATVYGSGLTLTDLSGKLEPTEPTENDCRAVWSADSDWLISLEDPEAELSLKVKSTGTVQFNATAQELNLSYRPCVSKELFDVT